MKNKYNKKAMSLHVPTCSGSPQRLMHRVSMRTSMTSRTPEKQRGIAAIEFAFVFPIFFMIFYAIITYGMIFVAQQSITLAAAEGARAALRYAASEGDRDTNARNAATGISSAAYWLAPRLTITSKLDPCPYNSSANSSVRCYRVTVSYLGYRNNPLVPLILGPLMGVAVPDQLASTAIIQID